MSILASRLSKSLSHVKTILPVAALALGIGLMTPVSAFAHGGGGGGGHGGGGGGSHGGAHGGGGFHGGGWHGGWGHGGWGHGGWDHGGWGWGGFGFYGGFYPWYGYGWDGSYNPFWAYGPDDYYGAAPAYGPGDAEGYGPEADGPGGYGPQAGGPGGYGPQSQYYPPASGPDGMPMDNSRGFYTWRLGVESGTCNRPMMQQIAAKLTGAQPAGLQVGAQLGGIPVQRVIGGRIGPRMDVTDQACATEALEHAPIGTTVRWETSSGIPVSFVVTKTVENQSGQKCRDYEATAQFASHPDTVRNTACKGTDGAWRTTR